MNLKEIEEGVRGIFQDSLEELKGKEIDLNKKQDEFESWDSFSHMEIASKCEEKFNLTLEMDEIVELDTPQKFVELIQKKISKK
jgi:acyl carrier protein|tara:strand:- start:70 stop:321 length:252 start_codon:yes stop_codon:yes gene_type:complete